jgi:putative transposase
MIRYRLEPTREQEAILLRHCSDARYVWNLAVEQHAWWRPGRRSAPGYQERCRQLTAARAGSPWLAGGSQTVQQQALRDFARATAGFFAGTCGRPSWRKAGRDEGFRVTRQRGKHWDVRRLNRNWGRVRVPKAGWVRFRWSRGVPEDARSFRVRRDRAGRWHVAFAVIPDPGWRTRNLYGSTVAVEDVSFRVEAGEIFGILGPNGAAVGIGFEWGLLPRSVD